MPTPYSSWLWLDLSPTIGVANQSQLMVKPVPVAGTIKEVWVGINTILTTGGGVVAVAKGSVNILSATNVNLGDGDTPDLTAATPESCTLTTAKQSLKVSAGDLIKATWTLTTAAVTNGATCLVAIEPDKW